jgi:hypothetical protein
VYFLLYVFVINHEVPITVIAKNEIIELQIAGYEIAQSGSVRICSDGIEKDSQQALA